MRRGLASNSNRSGFLHDFRLLTRQPCRGLLNVATVHGPGYFRGTVLLYSHNSYVVIFSNGVSLRYFPSGPGSAARPTFTVSFREMKSARSSSEVCRPRELGLSGFGSLHSKRSSPFWSFYCQAARLCTRTISFANNISLSIGLKESNGATRFTSLPVE